MARAAQLRGEILDLESLLGRRPSIEGEDATAYEALGARIRSAVEPRDVIEEIWIRDIVDNLWETLRLRRLKANMMRSSASEGLKKLLVHLQGGSTYKYDQIATGWARRDRAAVKSVEASLKEAGLTQEAIYAQTLAANLDKFERVDRMIMQTEARRNLVLREIDRHRDALARRLREAATEIEEGQFEVIDDEGAAP